MLRSKKAQSGTVTLEDLVEAFPFVSRSECHRYLRSFPRMAHDKLRACVEFRRRHGLLQVPDPSNTEGPTATASQGRGEEEECDGNDHQEEEDEERPTPPSQLDVTGDANIGSGGCDADDENDDEKDDDDARDWKWASDLAIEEHVRASVVASALSRAASNSRGGSTSGGFRRARLRLAAVTATSGGLLSRRRGREEKKLSPLYAQGIPQLLRCHLGRDGPTEGQAHLAEHGTSAGRYPIRDTSDHCIVHFLPALIDLSALDDPSPSSSSSTTTTATPAVKASRTFATALALYLHAKFDRQRKMRHRQKGRDDPETSLQPDDDEEEDERWTIVMDVRPGHGWPNPPAIKMLGFIREAAQMLFELYPGRLHRCIVFPVPSVAANVWQAAKAFLDPAVSGRVVVVAGPAEVDSPVPIAKLLPHVSSENLQIMEDARVAAFV